MIYILQFQGVTINLKKSILVIVQEIEFLGMIITSREMTLSAPKQKMENIGEMCLVFLETPKNIAADKTFRSFDFKDSGNTSCQATVPVSAAGTKKTYQLKNSYQATLTLGLLALKELQLWINNLSLSTGRSLIQKPPQITIQKVAPKTGWETFANGQKASGVWRSMEKTQHNNILEMKGIYLSLLTFTKEAKNATAPFR